LPKEETSHSPSTEWDENRTAVKKIDGSATLNGLSTGRVEDTKEYGLIDLVDMGLINNPTTRQAWETARSSAFLARANRSGYYPKITLQTTGGPSYSTSPTYPGFARSEQTTAAPALSITYLLLDFGSRAATAEAARQALFASNFSFNKTFQDVIYNVMSSYYNLDSKMSALEAAVVSLKNADSTLASVTQKKNAGLASLTDLLQARQSQAQAVYTLESARGDQVSARATLLQNLGLPANATMRIQPPPTSQNLAVLDTEVDRLIMLALERRPDVAAKMATMLNKKALARKANADVWPTISLGMNAQRTFYDVNYDAYPRHFAGDSHYNNMSATLTFSMDLFDGMNKVNTARSARSDAEAAKADLTQSELSAIADVVTSYNNVQTAVRKLASSQAVLDASQKAFDSTQVGYKNGLNSILDLLTAQNNLASARYQNIQARNDLFLSSAQLTRSTGTLSPKTAALNQGSAPTPGQP
jgi:outer membrane protein TolC